MGLAEATNQHVATGKINNDAPTVIANSYTENSMSQTQPSQRKTS